MHLDPSSVERVTAATNIPLGAVATFATVWLWRRRALHPLKATLWAGMFGSLMLASDLAVFAHGFTLEPETLKIIWHAIHAALALTVACFAAGAIYDRWGADATWRAAPGLLMLGAGFFAYATFVSRSFLPFILYEGVAMLFCLAVYATLAARRQLAGAGWMTAGVGITVLAAALQATHVATSTFVVPLDHNAVFHLAQLPGLLCLCMGLRRHFESLLTNTQSCSGSSVGKTWST